MANEGLGRDPQTYPPIILVVTVTRWGVNSNHIIDNHREPLVNHEYFIPTIYDVSVISDVSMNIPICSMYGIFSMEYLDTYIWIHLA